MVISSQKKLGWWVYFGQAKYDSKFRTADDNTIFVAGGKMLREFCSES